MSLDLEISKAAKQIYTDGYDMSIGEVVSLYKEGELYINPAFQRLFRWETSQKSRFIESLLMGIPIPPIFVFQTNTGVWELIDGLQRISTILEFMGILKKQNNELYPPSTMEATRYLPSLEGKVWDAESKKSIGKVQQIAIRRVRIRVEILKKESDIDSKYELFQRLNTGGSPLSKQEIRNAIMVMLNGEFFDFVHMLSEYENYKKSLNLSENQIIKQGHMENVLRLLSYKLFPYKGSLDVHDYIDSSMVKMIDTINFETIEKDFKETFDFIYTNLNSNAFKKYNGNTYLGAFSIAIFEAVAYGIFVNIEKIRKMSLPKREKFIIEKSRGIQKEEGFTSNSGMGVAGTSRLIHILPLASEYFKNSVMAQCRMTTAFSRL